MWYVILGWNYLVEEISVSLFVDFKIVRPLNKTFYYQYIYKYYNVHMFIYENPFHGFGCIMSNITFY